MTTSTLPSVAASPAFASPRAAATADALDQPIVRVDGLAKRFAVRRPLREVLRRPLHRDWQQGVRPAHFEVRARELFGLLGPNGAGKTTLFKMLATLTLPDEGTASVAGLDVVDEAPAVRRVLATVIADERSLNWRLDARENLRLYAGLHGLPKRVAAERVERLLGIVGLREAAGRATGLYSSGMRQRVLIARALLVEPRVLLLDEPTRSLDPVSARELRRFLREEVVGTLGCTVLLATHSAEEALELCDRVAVLDRGQVLAVGPARALAEEIGDRRFVLWVRDAHDPAVVALGRSALVRSVTPRQAAEPGWAALELDVPGGSDHLARLLHTLALAGVEVARAERVALPLADLIERVVRRGTVE